MIALQGEVSGEGSGKKERRLTNTDNSVVTAGASPHWRKSVNPLVRGLNGNGKNTIKNELYRKIEVTFGWRNNLLLCKMPL